MVTIRRCHIYYAITLKYTNKLKIEKKLWNFSYRYNSKGKLGTVVLSILGTYFLQREHLHRNNMLRYLLENYSSLYIFKYKKLLLVIGITIWYFVFLFERRWMIITDLFPYVCFAHWSTYIRMKLFVFHNKSIIDTNLVNQYFFVYYINVRNSVLCHCKLVTK